MARKKADYENIDNKFELAAYVIKKHWWKLVIIFLAVGIAVSGFSFNCGKNKIVKDPVYQIKGKSK